MKYATPESEDSKFYSLHRLLAVGTSGATLGKSLHVKTSTYFCKAKNDLKGNFWYRKSYLRIHTGTILHPPPLTGAGFTVIPSSSFFVFPYSTGNLPTADRNQEVRSCLPNLISSLPILCRKVLGLTPRSSAAPPGPCTLPPAMVRTCVMCCLTTASRTMGKLSVLE